MKLNRLNGIIMSTAFMLESGFNLVVIFGVLPLVYASMADIVVILSFVVTGIRALVLPIMNPEKVYGISFRQSGLSGRALYIVLVFMTIAWLATNIVLHILIKQSIDVSAAF